MKKLLIMLIVCLGMCLAACSQANIAPEGNDISNGVNNVDDPVNNNSENPAGKPADNDPETPAYYGDWQVTAYLCSAPVAGLSTSEIDQLVGTELAYDTDSFVVNGVSTDAPVYQETTITSSEFAAGYNNQLSLADLGITAEEVTAVSVVNSSDLGSSFYLKDANTLIISDNGVFFTATRK